MKKTGKILKINGIWFATIALYIIAIILKPNMFSWNQIKNLMKISAFIGTVSLGQTFAILLGGIDLSVAGVITATNVICCITMNYGQGSMFLGILYPIILGILVGFVKGVIITKIQILPMIVTLSLNSIIFGAILLWTGGVSQGRVSTAFQSFGDGSMLDVIPWTFVTFLVLAVIYYLIQQKTRLGHQIYAVGSNPKAAEVSGINVNRTIILGHIFCSLGAVVCGLLLSAFIGLPSFDLGDTYSTDSIATVVIGGTLMTGGVGGVGGTIGGAIFMTLLNSILNVMQVSVGGQNVLKGLIIVIGIVITNPDFIKSFKGKYLSDSQSIKRRPAIKSQEKNRDI